MWNPNPWERVRAVTPRIGQSPGWGMGGMSPHPLEPVSARGGRLGVVGVGEIMDGFQMGLYGVSGVSGGVNGLGAGSGAQIAMSVPSMTAGVLLAPGVTAAAGTTGGGTLAASLFGAAAVPIIGAAVAGVTIALMLIFSRKGPKQKTESTRIVEALIAQLQENYAAYMSGPRTVSSQQQALNNFDAGWTWLASDQGCGNPALGDPGRRCVSERQRGGIYDMWKDLRDPIANDPNVMPDPVEGGSVGGTATVDANGNVVVGATSGGAGGLLGGGNTGLLLAAAALAMVAFMGDR